MAVEVVCLLEETFPRSILTSQTHLMVHLIEDMSLCGPVSTRWMFFLERFMKTLKDFVRQNARPEGSMSEGWLIQEGLVFISQYLDRVDPDLVHSFSIGQTLRKREENDVLPQGQGTRVTMDRKLHKKINTFCILNSEVMRKWVAKYNETKAMVTKELSLFRRTNGRRAPIPSRLRDFPKTITCDWVHDEMERIPEEEKQRHITNEEWEYARGCLHKVSIFIKVFTPFFMCIYENP